MRVGMLVSYLGYLVILNRCMLNDWCTSSELFSIDSDCPSCLSVLEMKTTDFSKVTIRGVRANAYIAMNAQGNLYATVSEK